MTDPATTTGQLAGDGELASGGELAGGELAGGGELAPVPWSRSDRWVPTTVVRPAQRLMNSEAASAAVMLVAALVALAWANSGWAAAYRTFWDIQVAVRSSSTGGIELTLRGWITDGAMTLFFFLVALDIKRELVSGELRDRRAAALPVAAAAGGMVVPALIYVAFTAGTPAVHGWAIPMATDIAFAVGVVTLLGRRVPFGAKLFLLVLAIADDFGAILVIAVYYAGDLSYGWLGASLGLLALTAVLRRWEVRSLAPYLVLGVACWFTLHESGVHATVVGVAVAFLCPARPFHPVGYFLRRAPEHLARAGSGQPDSSAALHELARSAVESEPPLDRVARALRPWVNFGIVPLFALASAGVALSYRSFGDAESGRLILGTALGLVLGKTIGVFGVVALARALRLGVLPAGTTWPQMLGISVCAGIGFTVALFITGISFDQGVLGDAAKTGILLGSLVAGVAGWLILWAAGKSAPPPPV